MGGQRLTVLALAALLPAMAASSAFAEGQGGSAACRADGQKYCASEKDKKECLIDHQNDISEACYDALRKALKQGRIDSYEPAPATPVYKVKTADGRTLYTNAAVPNASEVKDRTNVALPIR
jgi:hypothetical protein